MSSHFETISTILEAISNILIIVAATHMAILLRNEKSLSELKTDIKKLEAITEEKDKTIAKLVEQVPGADQDLPCFLNDDDASVTQTTNEHCATLKKRLEEHQQRIKAQRTRQKNETDEKIDVMAKSIVEMQKNLEKLRNKRA